jgi:hypothetical protein
MPTYGAVERQVRNTYGFVPKTCWIAHVFEISGKKPRVARNRIDPRVRKNPCPPEKQPAVIEARRRLELQETRKDRSSL